MNLNANWVLQIDPVVYKFLQKISRKDTERILIVINNLPNDPFYGDIQKMEGEKDIWRRRIGAYRIRYELITKEKVVHVFRAERRASKTYQLLFEISLIAQEVEKLFPEYSDLVYEDMKGYKMIDYQKITVFLTEAIKELKLENDMLKNRLKKLETKLTY